MWLPIPLLLVLAHYQLVHCEYCFLCVDMQVLVQFLGYELIHLCTLLLTLPGMLLVVYFTEWHNVP